MCLCVCVVAGVGVFGAVRVCISAWWYLHNLSVPQLLLLWPGIRLLFIMLSCRLLLDTSHVLIVRAVPLFSKTCCVLTRSLPPSSLMQLKNTPHTRKRYVSSANYMNNW